MWIVLALNGVEDRHARFDLSAEPASIETLALQRREEAFAQRVVEAVTHRSHRGSDSAGETPSDRHIVRTR